MTPKTYDIISGLLFTLIFFLHGIRLIYQWEVNFNGWGIPLWVSIIVVLIAGPMAYMGFKIHK